MLVGDVFLSKKKRKKILYRFIENRYTIKRGGK